MIDAERTEHPLESPTPAGHRWIVAHTKSRQEKALCRELELGGVTHYLPLYNELRAHGNRRRWVRATLFPGYVFVRGDGEIGSLLRRTDRVAGVIEVPDQAGLVRELTQIRIAIDAGARFNPYTYLKEGHPARVKRGPLKGVEGMIDRMGSPTRLVLVVETLGRATSVEVNPSDVEAIR